MSRIDNYLQVAPAVIEAEDSYFIDDAQLEPNSVHITDDWDTQMEEYFDDFEDFDSSFEDGF